jgi:hypothetical protein
MRPWAHPDAACPTRQWEEHWQCDACSVTHQRDDNAAINLARYEEPVSVVGPVGAAVKRGADRVVGQFESAGFRRVYGMERMNDQNASACDVVVNVRDFGAKVDYFTDDTEAFQKAIDSAFFDRY